jgi:hypothetical protein
MTNGFTLPVEGVVAVLGGVAASVETEVLPVVASPAVEGRSVREQPAARGTRTLAARTVKWDAERDMGSSVGVAPGRGDIGRWEERQAGGQGAASLSVDS